MATNGSQQPARVWTPEMDSILLTVALGREVAAVNYQPLVTRLGQGVTVQGCVERLIVLRARQRVMCAAAGIAAPTAPIRDAQGGVVRRRG